MQKTAPMQPPPDLGLLLLTITTDAMICIVRDLLVPVVALGITLATLSIPVPRLPKQPAPAPAAALALPPAAPLALPPARVSLEALPVVQLRQLARAAGHKQLARSGRKAQLLEVLT
jgi:hypothetical protein